MSSGLSRTEVRELLERHGLRPSRALGQNFVCDQGTIDKIVRLARVQPGDHIVDLDGLRLSLDARSGRSGARVLAVELDQRLIPPLEEIVAGSTVTIIHHDALTLDWDAALDGVSADRSTPWSVVANLPYNVATPLVLDLLATQPRLGRWLVMVQKEVGDRLAASPGSKIYGIPSVLTAYWGAASVVGSVPPQVFFPLSECRFGSGTDRPSRRVTGRIAVRTDRRYRSVPASVSAERCSAAPLPPS